ncbi:MAG: hypothetical protein A3D92_06515 [Bacteroidetes bacterium RIFCSPHIGHO2_02_FULL_44_7]|nr:MAG: hypothetical protein A3D92_06515 [Bacteroidetes bacterium RIFCSPHIGHO2_02_FULL_44_7]
MRKKDEVRVSLAGEFAVLSQLALQGKDANMTLGNTKGVDILVSDPITGKMLKLEVKTNYRNEPRSEVARSEIFGDVLNCSGWILKKGNGNYDEKKDSNLFYCFVNIIKETKQCRFFVVPAKVVAKYVRDENKLWHREKKKEGKKVKVSDMRQFRLGFYGKKYKITTPFGKNYEDNWDFKSAV